jgi:hypothetical protein
MQVTDRHVDGRAQINFEIGVSFGSSIAKADDFSTQRNAPESSSKDAGFLLSETLSSDFCHPAITILSHCPRGGIGRHKGLKIPRRIAVPIRVRPWAPDAAHQRSFI